MTGDIQIQDLVISKLLGQDLDKYKSLFPHTRTINHDCMHFGIMEYVETQGSQKRIEKLLGTGHTASSFRAEELENF